MILVVGATGMLGGAILRRLLQRGAEVRALVRDPSAEGPHKAAGVECISGDLKDPASLLQACRDVSTVITTANSAARGGDDTVETVDLQGNRNLIEAASRSGVQHFIFVSAQGEDPNSPIPFLQAKGLTTKRLRESAMAHTVLIPDIYMDVWIPMVVLGPVASSRPVTIVGEGSHKHYFIAVEDVADFAVAAVGNDSARDRDLLIGGPEALSWHDVISTLERLSGVKVEILSLQPGEPMPGFPDAVSGLMASLETYDSPVPISSAEAEGTFGVSLTRLEDFLRRHTRGS